MIELHYVIDFEQIFLKILNFNHEMIIQQRMFNI